MNQQTLKHSGRRIFLPKGINVGEPHFPVTQVVSQWVQLNSYSIKDGGCCVSATLPHRHWPIFLYCPVPILLLIESNSEPQSSIMFLKNPVKLSGSILVIFNPNHRRGNSDWNKHLIIFWFTFPPSHFLNNTVTQGPTGCLVCHHGLPCLIIYTIFFFFFNTFIL